MNELDPPDSNEELSGNEVPQSDSLLVPPSALIWVFVILFIVALVFQGWDLLQMIDDQKTQAVTDASIRELASARTTHEEQAKEWLKISNARTEQITELEQQQLELISSITMLAKTEQEQKQKVETGQLELSQIQSNLTSQKAELNKIEADLSVAAAQLEAANEERRNMLVEHAVATPKIDALKTQIGKLESEVEAKKELILALNKELNDANSLKLEVAKAKAELAAAEERKNSAQMILDDLSDDLERLRSQRANLLKEKEQITNDVASLNEGLATAKIELSTLQAEVSKASAEVNRLSIEKARLSDAINSPQQESPNEPASDDKEVSNGDK